MKWYLFLVGLFIIVLSGCYQKANKAVEEHLDLNGDGLYTFDDDHEVPPLDTIVASEEVLPPSSQKELKPESISPDNTGKKTSKQTGAILSWKENVIDLGEMIEGDFRSVKVYFTNAGKRPLSIQKVVPSCGCTLPSFPFVDIDPGEEGFIGLDYNSVGKSGKQNASISVYGNMEGSPVKLTLIANVKEKKALTVGETESQQ